MDKKKKKVPKGQNGYVIPEQQVYAQQMYQPQMGMQDPYMMPYNQAVPQAPQPIPQSSFQPIDYSTGEDYNDPNQKTKKIQSVSRGIGAGATAIGGIFDTIGDIRRGIITGGSSLLNALIPDNHNIKPRAIQYTNSQDPYGNQTYNNMFKNGGEMARSGATVTNYGYGQPIEGLTPIQQAVLSGQAAPTSIQDVTSPNQPIPLPINQSSQYNYFSALPNGQFQMNIPRFLEDRVANSGYIGDNYSYHTNRPYGYEGIYGNADYIPTMQAGGTITNVKNFYDDYIHSPNYKKRLIHQGYNNVDKVITDRANSVKNVRVGTSNDGSEYLAKYNTAKFDKGDLKDYNIDMGTLVSHEFSHAAGSNNYAPNPNVNLNANDVRDINARNNYYSHINTFREMKDNESFHDAQAIEFKADMDTLRYNLKKDNIYDTGKQDFNQQYLNKAKQKYKNNGEIQRLLKRVSDKDLIYLMNNIAMNDAPNTENTNSYAANGVTISPIKARKILHDGTINNKAISEKQRKYFGWVANGSKAQDGTMINQTGYLDGAPTANNPMNIIPGQNGMTNITMDGVSSPIIANGQILPPNSGNYLFPGNSVVEEPLYKVGKSYNLNKSQLAELKKQGYEFE